MTGFGAKAQRLANRSLRTYVRRMPVERGKWRVMKALRPLLVRGGFTDESSLFGLRILCDVHDWTHHQVYYFGYNNNERVHTAYFRSLLRPGQVVIDCGANIGYYTLLAADGVRPGGAVHAFEPVRRTFERLRHNVDLNGFDNVILNQIGLGSEDGSAAIWLGPKTHTGASSLVAPEAGSEGGERIRVRRLDAYCDQARIAAVDIVKIDAEGFDFEVLKGAVQTLRRSPNVQVLVEVNRTLLARADSSPEELGSFMASIGFRPHRITERGAVGSAVVPEDNLVLFTRLRSDA